MARVCEVTGKKPMVGNNVSHANNKTKRRFLPNLQYRRFWVESENRWVRLRVSSAALRLIDKNGIDSVLADMRARGQARGRQRDGKDRHAEHAQPQAQGFGAVRVGHGRAVGAGAHAVILRRAATRAVLRSRAGMGCAR